MGITKDRLNQIISHIRFKRGLLNPLGSIVKLISGNLDNDDALRYNGDITHLITHREHSVEKRLSLMQKAFDKLVNVFDDIKYNLMHLNIKTSHFEKVRYNFLYQILNNPITK